MMKEHEIACPLILTGEIVHGKGLGRTVDMPTANLRVEGGILPPEGVYATRVRIGDKSYCSVTNIGQRPSVDRNRDITVETHILNFNQDIYGEIITLEICEFLRPIRQFSSLQEVQEQVQKDIVEAKIKLLCNK